MSPLCRRGFLPSIPDGTAETSSGLSPMEHQGELVFTPFIHFIPISLVYLILKAPLSVTIVTRESQE